MTLITVSWQGALSGKCGISFKDEACGDSMGLCVLALPIYASLSVPLRPLYTCVQGTATCICISACIFP
jgi:hypothetical protein